MSIFKHFKSYPGFWLSFFFFLQLPFLKPGESRAQSNDISGFVFDQSAQPLGYATVTLLYPSDSTLAYWGITNAEGFYEIKKAVNGRYLLQVGYLGMHSYWRKLTLPAPDGSRLEAIVMTPISLNLPEVDVRADHIPFLIRKDTIEYNAAAFRIKPDGVAEDLIRKLPGIEVDRVGNIRALGENVRNVLVDGKEFFSSDPKVATRNLPADAISKVQLYDRKSDQADLTGIADGERDKTVNLILKEDRKQLWFGEVKAGGGTGLHYQANAKAYRFGDKHQFAALGMLNNINQFGFSFQDYLDFSGGLQQLMGDGNQLRITLGEGSSIPVSNGEPVPGLVTSGAAGFNYSLEPVKHNRFNISYLGSLVKRDLEETVHTENFTSGSSFLQEQDGNTDTEDWNHALNLRWHDKSDSARTIRLNGGVSLVQGSSDAQTKTRSYSADTLVNTLDQYVNSTSNRLTASGGGSWMRKGNDRWRLFRLSGDIRCAGTLDRSEWENITRYLGVMDPFIENQYLRNLTDGLTWSAGGSFLLRVGARWHFEPSVKGGGIWEWTDREQGTPGNGGEVIDSLSPQFERNYIYLRPGFSFRFNNTKHQLCLGAQAEWGERVNAMSDSTDILTTSVFLLPRVSWEYSYRTGKRISLQYASSVMTPAASQLNPVVSNQNPLYLFAGNRRLKPEVIHTIFGQWLFYDAFTFTTLFLNANGTYTRDKISYARTVNESLGQSTTLINVPDDWTASLSASFSRPIRKLGLNVNLDIREGWNRSVTIINGEENININLTHSIRFSLDNRKKEKWDVSAGFEFDLTNARYSIQESMNTDYFDLVYFGEIRYMPTERWNFMMGADITNYNARSFSEAVSVPLLRAEVSYHFLKNNRMMISIQGYDLLNRNTGIERVSEQNYLRETRTNIIGRYVMLSLKYRINRSGGGGAGWNIKTS